MNSGVTEFTTLIVDNATTSHVGDYILPFTEAWVVASTFFVVFFFIFGVTANSITIAVIQKSPRLKTRYYMFLTSMCVSDIISAFVSILFLYRRVWGFLYFEWPEFFCRLYWGLDLWTSFATALHILSFAILRLIGVRWTTVFQRITSKTMKLWIAAIWASTFLGGFIPHFLFNTVNDIVRLNDPSRARWASCSLSSYWFSTWQVYVQIAYALFLYTPALSIIAISIVITVILRRKRELPTHKTVNGVTAVTSVVENSTGTNNIPVTHSRKPKEKKKTATPAERRWKKNKQVILQLLLIVGSFLFGYIPLTAFHFYTGFTTVLSNTQMNIFDWQFAMIQYLMLRFSECLNPVFYNAASKKMRGETKKMLKKAFFNCFLAKRFMLAEINFKNSRSSKVYSTSEV